jgi:hypothetical protein
MSGELPKKVRPSRETLGERMTTHGHTINRTISPTYRSWCAMMTRCTNNSTPQFKNYGAKGIKVCDQWHTFENFLRDMGERPSLAHSIDRFPNGKGNYELGNCRWATRSQQCRNRKTSRAVIRSDGVRHESMVEAAEAINGCRRCIRDVCIGRQKTHLGFSWKFAT